MDAQHWDELYDSSDQVFSGAPNGPLVAEVTGLPPGRALDVGCGEGGDAIWLARQGWQVTGADISQTALDRAAAAAAAAGLTGSGSGSGSGSGAGSVTWTRADLSSGPPPAGVFDLVSAHYVPLAHQPDHTALRGLLDAVAPGGTLLFATHDLADLPPHLEGRFDPAGYYQPDGIARLLGPEWTVLTNEIRPRTATAPAGTHHTHDAVLRARRTG